MNYLICKRPSKFADNFNKEIETQVVNFLLSNQTDSLDVTGVTVEQGLESFMKDYNNLHQYFPEIAAYELILNDSISFQNEKIISVVSSRYSYTGGAHGISSSVLLNFDVSNGELIGNDKLFTDLSKVLQVAENQFKKEQNINPSESLNEKGFWFDDDKFHLPQNVGFSDKYLILYYNPYEIAPYVAGSFEVKIPIDEVKPFLKYF
ncbi:MAG: DUF3298 domain-containing protein [Capnocytophaga sp.]|nr:DUF3298 domain-containing protein [Capnocytophaga sp.]